MGRQAKKESRGNINNIIQEKYEISWIFHQWILLSMYNE